MGSYNNISKELEAQILDDRAHHHVNPYAFLDENIVRRYSGHDNKGLTIRPAFVRDIEKIMNIPYYNRYNDKTQVFSLYRNDDITRRGNHVQLVSRIARNIGRVLGLNLDLIEAIALGHDIGHTPFGHAGEFQLSKLYQESAGKFFNHNIQSARVLDTIFPYNISLQTLDGIICHNGEMEQKEYRPVSKMSFELFDERMNTSYIKKDCSKQLVPSTLEACVVRISDIIAYLGKDRHDAQKLKVLDDLSNFTRMGIGNTNAEIINNITVDIIENSYGKDHLSMSEYVYEALRTGKAENYKLIYKTDSMNEVFDKEINPMIADVFYKLLDDLEKKDTNSVIYTHHIMYIESQTKFYDNRICYRELPNTDIVVDYIASMTDDYFIDLYHKLFPNSTHKVNYISYFEN